MRNSFYIPKVTRHVSGQAVMRLPHERGGEPSAHPSNVGTSAWIVQALVRDDGLTQVEAAHLLGQHKSWVCRRLALLEKLSAAVKEDLCLGLLGPALARQLGRLPAGNQGVPPALRDPRLSRAGNWLARYLTQAVDALTRIESWLRTPGERELTARDREIVQPVLEQLRSAGV